MVLPRNKRTEYLGGPSFAFSGVITLGVGPSVAVKFHHGAKLDLHNELKSPSRDESLRACRFKDYPVSLGYRCFTFLLHGFCAWGPSMKERELGGSFLMQPFFKAISFCFLWFHYLSCHLYAYKVLLQPKTKLSFNFGYFKRAILKSVPDCQGLPLPDAEVSPFKMSVILPCRGLSFIVHLCW